MGEKYLAAILPETHLTVTSSICVPLSHGHEQLLEPRPPENERSC